MASRDGNFAQMVTEMQRELDRLGLRPVDMRRAPALELQYAGAGEVGGRQPGRATAGIEPIEGRIEPRKVPPRDGPSGIRTFLDGAQRTLPVFRVGIAPVVVTIAAAAILERDARGECRIRPGTLRLRRGWLVPHIPGNQAVADVVDQLARHADADTVVVDTLQPRDGERDDARGRSDVAFDYPHLVERAYDAALEVRSRLEADLLEAWDGRADRDESEWLVVDGRLRRDTRNAIGLVKNFSDSHLSGDHAEMLLDLPEGYRTTAFNPSDRRRGGEEPEARSLWYLRLWNSDGLDARHALVRLETHQSVTRTEEIDRISSWVLHERTPRATGDDRWAVLLYPIHLLERALKRRVEADFRGWPA